MPSDEMSLLGAQTADGHRLYVPTLTDAALRADERGDSGRLMLAGDPAARLRAGHPVDSKKPRALPSS